MSDSKKSTSDNANVAPEKKRIKSFWAHLRVGSGEVDVQKGGKPFTSKEYLYDTFVELLQAYKGNVGPGDPRVVKEGECMFYKRGAKYPKQFDSLAVYRVFWVLYKLIVERRACMEHMLAVNEVKDELLSFALALEAKGQVRHLCKHNSKSPKHCVNPRHLLGGTAAENEVDKHFQYFLFNPDPAIRKAARKTFGTGGELALAFQKVYGPEVNKRADKVERFVQMSV